MKKKHKTLIVILYDSITNSVFESQVIAPLKKRNVQHPIHIISFESNPEILIPQYENIKFHIFKRYPFVHHMLLKREINAVRDFLNTLGHTDYEILARGPFAGYIAHKATDETCNITIQARGLVAEEYHYVHATNNRLSLLQRIRYTHLFNLEQQAYINTKNITIQAVSESLADYLIVTFQVQRRNITMAYYDMPQPIDKDERKLQCATARIKLGLSFSSIISCYSGSYKPWQCPEKVGAFFKHQLAQQDNAFLLILTPDVTQFQNMINKMNIPQDCVLIKCVKPEELFEYMSAANCGLLFREPHIINKVARPTKALEYQAAGLTIIHNRTVDYVNNMEDTLYAEDWIFESEQSRE